PRRLPSPPAGGARPAWRGGTGGRRRAAGARRPAHTGGLPPTRRRVVAAQRRGHNPDLGSSRQLAMNDRDQERTYLQTPEQWARFLSSFVHELRTPLASSRMLVDLLAESPP